VARSESLTAAAGLVTVAPRAPAGVGTARGGTRASRIGRWISAAPIASAMSAYHIQSYEPVDSKALPPSQAPRKPPTWWPSITRPKSVAMKRAPCSLATSPAVGGTVDR